MSEVITGSLGNFVHSRSRLDRPHDLIQYVSNKVAHDGSQAHYIRPLSFIGFTFLEMFPLNSIL